MPEKLQDIEAAVYAVTESQVECGYRVWDARDINFELTNAYKVVAVTNWPVCLAEALEGNGVFAYRLVFEFYTKKCPLAVSTQGKHKDELPMRYITI